MKIFPGILKRLCIKTLSLLLIFLLPQINSSSAYFTGQDIVSDNIVGSGCWLNPESVILTAPVNNSVLDKGDVVLEWLAATSSCPDIDFIYKTVVYSNPQLSVLYHESDFFEGLTEAITVAPGEYWWRVIAKDQTGKTSVSMVWHFTVTTEEPPLPTPTEVPSPSPTVEPTPTTEPTPTIEPTPPPEPTPLPDRNVVINEVMWMGSEGQASDEWIELRNMTDEDVDISNWNIYGAVSGSSGHLEIPAQYSISANGYFLIANYHANNPNSALNVEADLVSTSINFNNNYQDNGQLVLKDQDGATIDETPVPSGNSWPKGTNATLKQSMERNSVPGNGILAGSWHTCEDASCNDLVFWDIEGNNFGTPKSDNHSENDLSKVETSAVIILPDGENVADDENVSPSVTPIPSSDVDNRQNITDPEISPTDTTSLTISLVTPTPIVIEPPVGSPSPTPQFPPAYETGPDPTPGQTSELQTEINDIKVEDQVVTPVITEISFPEI